MNYDIKNWPFRWFGFWKEYGIEYLNYPPIASFIDEGINKSYRKTELLEYLRNGAVLTTTSQFPFPSPINGKRSHGTLSIRTDGRWLWLDSICELIEYHHLAIPEAFYKQIVDNDFSIPEIIEAQFEELEWPSL